MRSLVDVAVVGLERAGDLVVVDEASASLLQGLESKSELEQRFLLQLGIAAVRERAGRKTGTAPRPEPAPPETRAACSNTLAHLVADLCRERNLALLAEAFGRMDACGLRLPTFVLTELAALKSPPLQPLAGRVAGERGRWLATHNPDWRWLGEGEVALTDGGSRLASGLPTGPSPATRQKLWEEGPLPSRLAALKSLRAEEPAAGRAWVEAVWKEEKAAVREECIGALAIGLSLDDEPFLNRALGDRAVPVRAAAARLLARIEGSALARRMRARAETMVAYVGPSGARGVMGLIGALKAKLGADTPIGTLTVNPPASFGADWAQDGLLEKPPAGMGEKAFWIAQILAQVPPTHWERHCGTEPDALVAAAAKNDWAAAILAGWLEASIFFGARSWAAPLLLRYATQQESSDKRWGAALRLFPLLRQEEAEAFVTPLLSSPTPESFQSPLLALATPWSAGVASAFLETLERALQSTPEHLTGAYAWKNCMEKAASALPGDSFARALALVAPEASGQIAAGMLRSALDSFHAVLNLRQRIHEETRP